MVAWVAVGAVVLAGSTVAAAAPVGAVTVTVNTTADGGPGSLRAAIDRANAGATPTTIVLVHGSTYDLTRCDGDGTTEDDTDVAGDLDVLAAQPVTVKGRGATIRQTCPHADHERVLDLRGDGPVLLDQVTITGGFGGSPEDRTGHLLGGGIRTVAGPLTLDRSTVTGNSAETGGGIWAGHALTLRRSIVSDNVAAVVSGGVFTGGLATVEWSTISHNRARVVGGIGSRAGLILSNSSVTSNHADDEGGGVLASDAEVTIDRSTISDNESGATGGGIGITGGSSRITGTVSRSTISGNRAQDGAGIVAVSADLRVVDSTIVGNQASRAIGGLGVGFRGTMAVQWSTVTGNEAPVAANLGTAGFDTPPDPADAPSFSTFATVVADALGGGSNCAEGSPDGMSELGPLVVPSGGYSYDTDGTCGFGAAVGDVSAGPDPRLSSLADHGGPTLTRQPVRSSPLLDVVPAVRSVVHRTRPARANAPRGHGVRHRRGRGPSPALTDGSPAAGSLRPCLAPSVPTLTTTRSWSPRPSCATRRAGSTRTRSSRSTSWSPTSSGATTTAGS